MVPAYCLFQHGDMIYCRVLHASWIVPLPCTVPWPLLRDAGDRGRRATQPQGCGHAFVFRRGPRHVGRVLVASELLALSRLPLALRRAGPRGGLQLVPSALRTLITKKKRLEKENEQILI